jgi:hypothetical protein
MTEYICSAALAVQLVVIINSVEMGEYIMMIN